MTIGRSCPVRDPNKCVKNWSRTKKRQTTYFIFQALQETLDNTFHFVLNVSLLLTPVSPIHPATKTHCTSPTPLFPTLQLEGTHAQPAGHLDPQLPDERALLRTRVAGWERGDVGLEEVELSGGARGDEVGQREEEVQRGNVGVEKLRKEVHAVRSRGRNQPRERVSVLTVCFVDRGGACPHLAINLATRIAPASTSFPRPSLRAACPTSHTFSRVPCPPTASRSKGTSATSERCARST